MWLLRRIGSDDVLKPNIPDLEELDVFVVCLTEADAKAAVAIMRAVHGVCTEPLKLTPKQQKGVE